MFRYSLFLSNILLSLLLLLLLSLLLLLLLLLSLLLLLLYSLDSFLFHTSISKWFLTGGWVTASLLKFPGLFSINWPILIILSFGLSLLVLLFPSLSVPLSILWWLSCSLLFQFTGKVYVLISLFTFFQCYLVVSRNGKIHYSAASLFCWLSQGVLVWPKLDDPFVSQNPWEFCTFPGRIPDWAYTICSYIIIIIIIIIMASERKILNCIHNKDCCQWKYSFIFILKNVFYSLDVGKFAGLHRFCSGVSVVIAATQKSENQKILFSFH